MMRWSPRCIGGIAFDDLETSGHSRGADSIGGWPSAMGTDGSAVARVSTGDCAGAVRIFFLRRRNWTSRLSFLDGHVRVDSGLRDLAVSHGVKMEGSWRRSWASTKYRTLVRAIAGYRRCFLCVCAGSSRADRVVKKTAC